MVHDHAQNQDDWRKRWREERLGFHQEEVNQNLQAFMDQVAPGPSSRVLVPLAGKTKDIPWLASRGYSVVSVELVESAVEAMFTENGLPFARTELEAFVRFEAENIVAYAGDYFRLTREHVGDIQWVFDRASYIALPEPLRVEYATHLRELMPPDARSLLVTIAYDQPSMTGPPYSCSHHDVRSRFARGFSVEHLETKEALPVGHPFRQRGLTWLEETIWRVTRT